MEAADEQGLRAQHVADACHDALIEDHVADGPVAAGLDARPRMRAVETGVRQVRAQHGKRPVAVQVGLAHELGHRHVKGHRHPGVGVELDARRPLRPLPAFAWAIEMPGPAHAHMRAQHERA